MHPPTPEHEWLRSHLGEWKVECELHMTPGQPPITYTATDSAVAVGPYWRLAHFRAQMPGMPYEGHSTVGFDPKKGKFVSTWVDVMGPQMSVFEGQRDTTDSTKIHWLGVGDSPFGPGSRFEAEEVTLSHDERTFRMWVRLADGKEVPMLNYRYRRA